MRGEGGCIGKKGALEGETSFVFLFLSRQFRIVTHEYVPTGGRAYSHNHISM